MLDNSFGYIYAMITGAVFTATFFTYNTMQNVHAHRVGAAARKTTEEYERQMDIEGKLADMEKKLKKAWERNQELDIKEGAIKERLPDLNLMRKEHNPQASSIYYWDLKKEKST